MLSPSLQSGGEVMPPEHMQAYKAETGQCLQSTCKIRSGAYACVFRMGSLPVPSELCENGVPKPPTLQGRGRLAAAKGWVGIM